MKRYAIINDDGKLLKLNTTIKYTSCTCCSDEIEYDLETFGDIEWITDKLDVAKQVKAGNGYGEIECPRLVGDPNKLMIVELNIEHKEIV